MVGKVYTASAAGIDGIAVSVEADIGNGLPSFDMVGYLGSEVKEARERVRTALKNSGFLLPPCRITVNLSPADLRKQGNCFDLPVAVAILAAAGFLTQEYVEDKLFIGELGLDGQIRPVNGILVLAGCAQQIGISKAVVPVENAAEAAHLEHVSIYAVETLQELVDCLNRPSHMEEKRKYPEEARDNDARYGIDFSDIRGQELLKRATMVAAAGMHNLLYIGPPGSGKSMAAKRIPTILPPMTKQERLEVTKIYSISGLLERGGGLVRERPFRSPHHTISPYALAGGGNVPKPGEISLAHNGVLFLDELPEFKREVLEIMRQPLEDGKVTISRLHGTYVFPAGFMLAAAMNPCPCGYYPDRNRCHCSPGEVRRYRDRISQPLLDRIDICTEAQMVPFDELVSQKPVLSSAEMKDRVCEAMLRQRRRYELEGILYNSQLSGRRIREVCRLNERQEQMMRHIFENMGLSARARDRILRVARTIADIDAQESIQDRHLAEAVGYRSIDRKFWGVV